jgi:acyl-CoA thioesterase-2
MSAPGVEAVAERLRVLGMKIEIAGDRIGDASLSKMLRSIFIKGIEALMLESLTAARHAGIEERILDSVQKTLPGIDWRELAPDNPDLHRNVLAYVSDYQLVSTATLPHGIHFAVGNVQLASLDHAMWFHRPFRVDDWLLYAMESPNASGGSGLALGRFFTRDGRLVASTAQEGVVRVWR